MSIFAGEGGLTIPLSRRYRFRYATWLALLLTFFMSVL
jgi:hypothetical protein